jgi:hypothetical protein
MIRDLASVAVVLLFASVVAQAADQARRVVIYEGVTTQVAALPDATKDLWVTMTDLKRATGFVVKPQGVCREQLCFPLPKDHKADFVSKKGRVSWFNLTAFARLIKQPVAFDEKIAIWYFGPRPDVRDSYISSLDAPDFALPDAIGKMHSLSDFKGKKVLLVTWASW